MPVRYAVTRAGDGVLQVQCGTPLCQAQAQVASVTTPTTPVGLCPRKNNSSYPSRVVKALLRTNALIRAIPGALIAAFSNGGQGRGRW